MVNIVLPVPPGAEADILSFKSAIFRNSVVAVVAGNVCVPKGVRVVRNHDYRTTNEAYAAALGLSCAPKKRPSLLVCGASIDQAIFLSQAKNSCVPVSYSQGKNTDQESVGVVALDGKVLRFAHGLDNVWVRCVLLRGRERELFISLALHQFRRRLFIHEVLNEVIDQGGIILEKSHVLLTRLT